MNVIVVVDKDNCPSVSNQLQESLDVDGIGDICSDNNDNDYMPDNLIENLYIFLYFFLKNV